MMRLLLLASVCGVLGCSSPNAFPCETAAQCVKDGKAGVCAAGFCAFADGECDSGYRYESNAGEGLAQSCLVVDAGMPDAALCGEHGLACCETGTACETASTCESGTCASCIKDVVLGRRYSCVHREDNSVWCAGENAQGQLGFGLSGVPSAVRMQVRDASGNPIVASAVSAGRETACALTMTGGVLCWGANDFGQIGNGAVIPTMPPALPGVARATVVKKIDNTPLTDIVEIAGGYNSHCARDTTGGVWCWGKNNFNQLGDGTTTPARSLADRVLDAPAGAPLTGALKLWVNGERKCVLKANDEVWCWGANGNAELPDGTMTRRGTPVLTMAKSTGLALGQFFTCWLEPDTSAACVGWNGHARMGIGVGENYQMNLKYQMPQTVKSAAMGPALTGIAEIAIGGLMCVRMTTGAVLCSGDTQYGQVGAVNSNVPVPILEEDGTPLTGIDRLVVNYAHACARRTNGQYVCWGRNSSGDFGDGTFMNRAQPVPLQMGCP